MSDALRVHTDSDGLVWCGQNGVGAHCTDFSPEEFVTKNVFKTAPIVRAMGSPINSKLLLGMYERHRKAPALSKRAIWLASPAVCATDRLRNDPEEVLYRLWQSDTTARVSANWHLMKSVDFNAHLLRLAVDAASDSQDISDKAKVIFQYHPTFGALSFFEDIDVNSAIRLLSIILDPRWYVHPERPSRLSKLMRFLGLIGLGAEGGGYNRDRSAVVSASWYTRATDEVDYDSPRNFLWRIFRHHGGGERGYRRASESFIRFIVLHWLQDLSSSSKRLFDPDLFFKTAAEVTAYNAHIIKVRS
tara:strand:- start:6526 stop:7434 length:909 start_codon:yes stop_codon:yes gene_type:complete